MLAAWSCALAGTQNQVSRFNAAVIDRDGNPVTGLTRADFRVQENGKDRDIAFFRFTGERPGPHATVILLDLLNEPELMSGAVITDQLTRALKNFDSTADLYLYFTTVTGELYPVRAIPKAMMPQTDDHWTRNLPSMLDSALKALTGFRLTEQFDPKTRVDLTMRAVRGLAGQMGAAPGRKNLIWVTRGIPMNGYSLAEQAVMDYTPKIRALAEQLQWMQITVYPVGAPIESESDMALNEIAGLTGGRKLAFGAIGEAIQAAQAATRGNYEMAFLTSAEPLDGKHRKIRVICSHKDARVLTVSGFYDVLPTPKAADLERALVEEVAHSPFEASEIGVKATLTSAGGKGNENLDIRVSPADLWWREVNGRRAGDISIALAVYGPAGLLDVLALGRQEINLTPDEYAAAGRDGIAVHRSGSISKGARRVRVVVVDGQLGAAGSVTVSVPDI